MRSARCKKGIKSSHSSLNEYLADTNFRNLKKCRFSYYILSHLIIVLRLRNTSPPWINLCCNIQTKNINHILTKKKLWIQKVYFPLFIQKNSSLTRISCAPINYRFQVIILRQECAHCALHPGFHYTSTRGMTPSAGPTRKKVHSFMLYLSLEKTTQTHAVSKPKKKRQKVNSKLRPSSRHQRLLWLDFVRWVPEKLKEACHHHPRLVAWVDGALPHRLQCWAGCITCRGDPRRNGRVATRDWCQCGSFAGRSFFKVTSK